jgi:uncharacterized membrane protein
MPSNKNSQNHRAQLTRLEDEVIRTEPELFTGLPKDRARKIVQTVAISMKSHSGPLPDPETLNRYNEIIPNGADRIMIGFEKQLDHRIDIENHAIKGQVRQSDRGQLFAFIIAIAVLLASFWLINQGHDTAGTILGSVDLVALVTVFITGKAQQKKNLQEKK